MLCTSVGLAHTSGGDSLGPLNQLKIGQTWLEEPGIVSVCPSSFVRETFEPTCRWARKYRREGFSPEWDDVRYESRHERSS